MDSGSPFAALLIGQPTLRHRLRLGVLAALDQRISVRYALAGMTPDDTAGYLTHHLKIAGRADTPFSSDAVTVIHNAALGYPRAVNNLAINALTAAFARKNAIVDEKAARIAVTENGGDQTPGTVTTPITTSPRRPMTPSSAGSTTVKMRGSGEVGGFDVDPLLGDAFQHDPRDGSPAEHGAEGRTAALLFGGANGELV